MAATSFNRRIINRAPPPTPIATAKGIRSAAFNDEILSRYLESSLRIPNLTLPIKNSMSPAEIKFESLINGDYDGLMERFMESGVFGIEGDESAEIGRELFQEKEEDVSRFRGEGVRLEAYRVQIFREKVKKVTTKLEMVAESIAKLLSQHIGNKTPGRSFHKMQLSIIYRKNGDPIILSDPHALSLHITGNDHKFCIITHDSTSFALPNGSILVTIGKQFEELSNGKLKMFNGDVFLELREDEPAPFFLEFMYTFTDLNCIPNHSFPESDSIDATDLSLSKTLSVMDQLSIMLILIFFYYLLS